MSHTAAKLVGGVALRAVALPKGAAVEPRLTPIGYAVPVQPLYTGAGYIAGTVTAGGQPASRPVRLYHRATGVLVRSAQSAADGSYRFDGLNPGEVYLVLATDADVNAFNAAAADLITPATE